MTLSPENLEIFSLSVLLCTLPSHPGGCWAWIVHSGQWRPLIGHLLPSLASDWSVPSNRTQCSDAFQLLSRLSRAPVLRVLRPIIAHLRGLLTFYIFVACCHSIDQHNLLHTDNVIVNYFYQPAQISRNKKVTQEGISFKHKASILDWILDRI